jgi:hypothetical protein
MIESGSVKQICRECGDEWHRPNEFCSKCGLCFYCCKHESFDYGHDEGVN